MNSEKSVMVPILKMVPIGREVKISSLACHCLVSVLASVAHLFLAFLATCWAKLVTWAISVIVVTESRKTSSSILAKVVKMAVAVKVMSSMVLVTHGSPLEVKVFKICAAGQFSEDVPNVQTGAAPVCPNIALWANTKFSNLALGQKQYLIGDWTDVDCSVSQTVCSFFG